VLNGSQKELRKYAILLKLYEIAMKLQHINLFVDRIFCQLNYFYVK